MKKKFFQKTLAMLMVLAMVAGVLPATALDIEAASVKTSSGTVSYPDDRVYINSTKYAIVPGVEELVLTTNNSSGTDQRIGFVCDVNQNNFINGNIQIVACYKDYSYDNLGFQTVTDQAAAYEKATGNTVVAAVNADFFNMTTGEPSGLFVMDGTVYHKDSSRPYFAILKDGTAVIREAGTSYSDAYQAVGGDQILVKDGVAQPFSGDYATIKYSRCAIGIREDGSVVTYTTHGISTPTSCGESYSDLADMFVSQGCVIAMNLDGGGSATFASVREGSDKLIVQNSPSDGTPRTVSTTLLIVSTMESTGEFDHASLTPNNEYYTPTIDSANPTTVEFEAAGVDASGTSCDLPESDLVWGLASGYEATGTINQVTGIFTAAKNYTGEVVVELSYKNEVVGTTSIQIVEPDEIAFSGRGVSLDFGEKSDLGLTVKGEGVILNHKDGDFDWTIECRTNGISTDTFGTMSGNTFTCGEKQSFSMEGDVTVKYTKQDGTEISATIFVEIGKMPIVSMDFETLDERQGKNVVGLWDWGTTASYFFDSSGAAVTDQVYQFQNYTTLYYLQSTTYALDNAWINEVYTTEQPWTENGDGTVSVKYEEYFGDKEYIGTVERTYGEHAQKWVSFTDENGDGYYWRGYIDGDTWSGNFNAGGGSASAFLGADGYDMYVWHTNANPTDLSGTLHGEGSQIVDSSEGEVRFGDYSLKLTYDYTNFSPTGGTKNCNTYYRVTNNIEASGSPTGLGMWVYAPEGMSNFWFWTTISYWNGTSWDTVPSHFKPAGAEKSLQYTGINWTGWTYVEADLASVYDAGAVVDEEHPLQIRSGNALIQMTYIPGGTSDGEGNAIVCGSKSSGYFYIDNVRWVYGTNVDDMDDPIIMSAAANGITLSVDEATVIDSNDISFAVDFMDPQGENYSGIDETATQIFVDGAVLTSDQFSSSADRAQTEVLSLANGEHTIEVNISDNFGNKTSSIYKVEVENPDTEIPIIMIARPKAAELGGNYEVVISADCLEKISSISTNINYDNASKLDTETVFMDGASFYDDYGNKLTQGNDGNYYDADGKLIEEPMRPAAGNYSISNAVQILGENLTGTIRNKSTSNTNRAFTASATVNEEISNDTTLLKFTLPIPNSMIETDVVPVTITVNFTTTDGNTYTVSTGKITNKVEAYYDFVAGIQISGSENGTITVIPNNNGEADTSNLKVYVDGTAIDGTWNDDVFTTSYFTALDGNTTVKNVSVGDAVNGHYSFKEDVYVCNYAENGSYTVSLNATTGDSNTMEQITWLSGEGTDVDNVQVQYMTKADYEAALDITVNDELEFTTNVEEIFKNAKTVSGTSKLTDFVLSGVDFVAVYVNNATLAGLKPGTEYVCRTGDGVTWSEVTEFSTYTDDGVTEFVVMGDAQLHGNDITDAAAIASLKALGTQVADVDFGIQTGDFVDGGTNFTQWEQILRQFGAAFEGIDFVHTMGNHEAYTSVGTTAGTEITTRLYGLTSDQTKFYSVEYGDVYVAVINQAATADLSEAAAWLIEDAAKTDCTWKVMVVHQPVYYTNPNGSSDGHHNILAPACDEAGIDFVFSGHDHSYARTEQIFKGEALNLDTETFTNMYVDKDGNVAATQGDGTVYFICGSMDAGGEYAVVNNADFHFAKATNDYHCIYLTVKATEGTFTVNAYDMAADGTSKLIDTFTMYNGTGICNKNMSHDITVGEALYNPETGMLVCATCGEEVDPVEMQYTGYAVDVNGEDEYGDSQYYLFLGVARKGWFAMGEEFLYADDAGLLDHKVYTYSTNTCTENGKIMAYSPRYDLTYTGGIARYTGHVYNENYVCTTCGHEAIDVAEWTFSLAYTSATYSGKVKTPAITIANPETGEKLEFHTDGTGIMSDYIRTWRNNKNVGTATVTIEMNAKGDYYNSKGAVTLELQICPELPTDLTATAGSMGEVTINWTTAASSDSYIVYYSTDGTTWKKAGTTSETNMTISGLDSGTTYYVRVRSQATVDGVVYKSLKYTEAVQVETVAGYNLSTGSVKQTWTSTVYNGSAKKYSDTSLKVYDENGNPLTRNKDYTVTYKDNVNVGTATVTITGKGNYEGTLTATFKITKQSLTNTATVTAADTVYAAGGTKTVVSVVDKNGITLEEGVDYTLTYADNNAVGVATVTITGMGNYSGSTSATFVINEKSVADLKATVDADAQLTYTGEEIVPEIIIDGLAANRDYTVTYENNINAGEATAVITGVGNYNGTLKVNYTITPATLKGSTITDATTYTYTGKAIEAEINVITENGASLIEDVDYVVDSYKNNVNVGTATVAISGIGNYEGTLSHEYTIVGANIQTFNVELDPETFVYDGENKVPALNVTDADGNQLVKDIDYTMQITNNCDAGNGVVTVTGIGNYVGEITKTFEITPADIAELNVKLSYTKTTYSGALKTPAVTVKTAEGETLVAETDYVVSYENNKNAGTAKVIIKGIGNYGGTVTKNFTINHASIANCTATLNETEFYYTGDKIEPLVTVKTAKGTTLRQGVNYEVIYTDNVEVGTAIVTIKGINNYASSQDITFTIKKSYDLTKCAATLNFTLTTYNGNAKTPGVTVKTVNGTTLKKGTNYTVEYNDNVEVGTATVTITGIGKYYGTITKTFKIRPERPTNLTVASKTSTSIKVQFSKVAIADKYYIYVDGKYAGCTVTKDYYTIKGLNAGTTYKISVKAVKEVEGVKYYSQASSSISITTNK